MDDSVDVWIFAVEAGMEERAPRGAFLDRLSDEMKSAKEFPVSLDTLITLCIQII